MTRAEILGKAIEITCNTRQSDYGPPEDSFGLIAEFWNTYIARIEFPIDAQDVAAMMILLKVARHATGGEMADNWVDMAGYAACASELGKEAHKNGA